MRDQLGRQTRTRLTGPLRMMKARRGQGRVGQRLRRTLMMMMVMSTNIIIIMGPFRNQLGRKARTRMTGTPKMIKMRRGRGRGGQARTATPVCRANGADWAHQPTKKAQYDDVGPGECTYP